MNGILDGIPRATGAAIEASILENTDRIDVTEFGASPGADAVTNTRAINEAIAYAAGRAPATVVIPAGTFRTYTIVLASRVNLYLSAGCVVEAARTDIRHGVCDVMGERFIQSGDGGNYLEPEVNRYVGLQDHAHSYLRNALVWGDHVEYVMIYGPGRFDGGRVDADGVRRESLTYSDPADPARRDVPGHRGEWFGNKGIALFHSSHVVLADFEMLMCGHFAIITTGCADLLVSGLTVDTNRDGIDIDSCEDVTVRGCTFNTMHDDGIVIKSSYGAQRFMPSRNVLVEDCDVSAYDTGSVLAGLPSTDRPVCHPHAFPVGRVKLGTEATGGYERVTIRDIRFRHCSGLALEAVDGSDMTDIVAEHLRMEDLTSEPLYIRVGDRSRFPVTGLTDLDVTVPDNDVRVDDARWVIPNKEGYECWPARRYAPAYRRRRVEIDGEFVEVIDPQDPVVVNEANHVVVDGVAHPLRWDEGSHRYEPDMSVELDRRGILERGNAIGNARMAQCRNVLIRDMKAVNVDPRYPITITGLKDGRIGHVMLEDIDVTWRGGITMDDAIEQRRVWTPWTCRETDLEPVNQPLPWMVEHHVCREARLPRVRWDAVKCGWVPAPFAIPEGVTDYPEPDQFGILPAYAMYVRHVDDLTVRGMSVSTLTPDGRPPLVLDDVHGCVLDGVTAPSRWEASVVTVTNPFARRTGCEYLPGEPYVTTEVTGLTMTGCTGMTLSEVRLEAPSPGTPPDALYDAPTIPSVGCGYRPAVSASRMPLPRLVYPPYFAPVGVIHGTVGQTVTFPIVARDPADALDAMGRAVDPAGRHPVDVQTLTETLPVNATVCWDAAGHGTFSWVPEEPGEHQVEFAIVSGVLPVRMCVTIIVNPEPEVVGNDADEADDAERKD